MLSLVCREPGFERAVRDLLAAVLVVTTLLACAPQRAVAQDAPADAPAAQDAAPVAPPSPTAENDIQLPMSRLAWLYNSLGLFYSVVFLGLSFSLVALIVMNILGARREAIAPAALVEQFEAAVEEKRYQDAYEMAKNDESFLGQLLAAGLSKLSYGYPQAIEAMQEVGEIENMKLEHRLSYVALIGTISPMVGLLGTVHGMIVAFIVIASSQQSPKPSELAGGISTALVTTAVGLLLAIPALVFYGIMRNWISRAVLEVGIVSDGLISRIQRATAKRAPAAGGASPPQK